MTRWLSLWVLMSVSLAGAPWWAWAGSFDHLTDLTGKVMPIVTLTGRDNFTSEYRYDISVRNHSPDPIVADSLIVVLDKITNLAGEEREVLKNEAILSRFEVLGQDGETDDGKAFFRIPAGTGPDLLPQASSRPAMVRLRNKDYLAVFTPSFRIYGLKRQSKDPKAHETKGGSTSSPNAPAARNQVEALIQLLIKKGLLTEEEWRQANPP